MQAPTISTGGDDGANKLGGGPSEANCWRDGPKRHCQRLPIDAAGSEPVYAIHEWPWVGKQLYGSWGG